MKTRTLKTVLGALGLACLCGCLATGDGGAEGQVILADSFDLSKSSCGMGKKVNVGRSVDGHALTVSGKVYERGFGTHPESAVTFKSNGEVQAFDALVGIDDDAAGAGSGKSYGKPTANFFVWADGRIVWTSGPVKLGQQPVRVHVDLLGAREIVLETRGGPIWTAWDAANADWLEPLFTCRKGAKLKLVDDPETYVQLGILTPPEKETPQFNGADIWGVRPGRQVIFRIPVSGIRPMKFTAKGLPSGVTLDPERGILGGVAPAEKGDYDIVVTAANAKGSATRTIRLAVGDVIALTPPMGWNSWNVWCYRLTAECVKSSARTLDESGLGDHGWAYVNLDDWWEMNNSGCERVKMREADLGREDVIGAARAENGKILPNRSFPDMAGLADYVHGLGFKIGLYSSPGSLTCGKCTGSYQHELQDAESWADWGFDYVKYDWCSYQGVFKERTHGKQMPQDRSFIIDEYARPYRIMNECLKKQKRDIVYSFCQYGMAEVERWARDTGANCWRSWDDLKDGWAWMESAIDGHINAEYWKYSGPGCWADPDMMIIGRQYSFGSDHPTYLTPNEQYTHVSIWAMIGAPLLIGCDLSDLDKFTRSLLVNDGVIAISQDRLGKVAKRIRHVDGESVWVRPLADGATAVALVNRSPVAREIGVSFVELGLGRGQHWVKDVWRQKCEGKHAGTYAATIPPHATKLLYVRPVDCARCE